MEAKNVFAGVEEDIDAKEKEMPKKEKNFILTNDTEKRQHIAGLKIFEPKESREVPVSVWQGFNNARARERGWKAEEK